MTVLGAIDRFFRPAYPAKRIAALRILIGGFGGLYAAGLAIPMSSLATARPRSFAPTGPVALLSAPLPAWALYATIAVAALASVPFTLGWRFRVTGPLFAAAFVWIASYRSSFGMVFHTENLLALHLVVLALGDAAGAWSLDASRRSKDASGPEDAPRFGWPVRLMSLVTVTTYVLAGVAKLRHSGGEWLSGDILTHQIAYDNVRKAALGDAFSPIGAWVVRHGWALRPLAIVSVVFELGAPFALVGGRVTKAWAAVAWSFHAGVVALMAIFFPYPMLGFAFVSMFAPERIIERLIALRERRRARRAGPAVHSRA